MAGRRIADLVTTKVLGIDVNERYSNLPPNLESRARDVLGSAHAYLEEEPSVAEFFDDLAPDWAGVVEYVQDLFPSASWIRRYNMRWLAGDMISGVTIGLVVIPQALAYASLAHLPPAYGLYTSFTGAALYWMFGTSKDIAIGTTAVGSLLVGQVVTRVDDAAPGRYSADETARALSLLSGAVLLFVGLFRLGWIIEFIPYIPISAFVTSASITIMSTQVPTALGIPDINTREPPYRVIINTLRSLPNVHLDAAIGLSAIVLLFAIGNFCSMMEARQPAQKRLWNFISSLRLTFTMLLFTLISFLVHRTMPPAETKFRIVGHIEQGFREARVPQPDVGLIKAILPELPAVAIILVIGHIAIAKAMGRLYSYTINPSQEVVALGAANLLSPFVGGYVCTGSFGASAVLSKAGARSPLAGLFGAGVLVLTLYTLTAVFYYIPKAALAGLIIHAVCNLLTPPRKLYKYWQLSPLELLVWVVSVMFAIFISLEASIYSGVLLSFVFLLTRIARTRGTFLGRVRVQRVAGGKCLRPDEDGLCASRKVFLPLDGVFVYRLNEGYNYTNQAYHMDTLNKHVMEHTKRMSAEHFEKESDRLWNDPGPRVYREDTEALPYLRAVVLDFAAVNHVDVTSVQGLIDLRNLLDSYSSPDAVEWHFANVHNRWTRRALAAAGFGYPTSQNPMEMSNWKPLYSIAATLTGMKSAGVANGQHRADTDVDEEKTTGSRTPGSRTASADSTYSAKRTASGSSSSSTQDRGMASVSGVNRPFFHVDLQDAVDSAVLDARSKDENLL
ncbi:sulfate permease family domain-containing protein [Hirsutella rhossiliensis]|uniref:Sulfate permease family domain-containing protein n=1 Tax=Hirsutella rhossiliensis TaxID=111463 RepID=A0A9P8SMB4_9HYPO|nr:sulfate permease family domain-containing protein [Hirsutella rhossiliensis]KAH0966665.1 sulfate permease family domain-containing protein [Hirsutella rhossiliensis]